MGCAEGKPAGDGDWQSDGCLLGNIAYNKSVSSNTVVTNTSLGYRRPDLWYNGHNLVDGKSDNGLYDGSCTMVYTQNKYILPWIMIDLQKTYTIQKVTLINTVDYDNFPFLENFYIRIGNSSNISQQKVCKQYFAKQVGRGAKETIACNKPLTGRYISIKKYSRRYMYRKPKLALCEFLVFGYEPIQVDWDKCTEESTNSLFCIQCVEGHIPPNCQQVVCDDGFYGTNCDRICGNCWNNNTCNVATGTCSRCESGWKLPKCNSPCPLGTYGQDCAEHCGKCENNTTCDRHTGVCSQGCEMWYADDLMCKTNIPAIDLNDLQPKILFVKDTWAILLVDIPMNNQLQKYYKIKLFYLHDREPLAQRREYSNFTIHHNHLSKSKLEIRNLAPNTQYRFFIQIYRQKKDILSVGGKQSKTVYVTTMSLVEDGQNQDFSRGSSQQNMTDVHKTNVPHFQHDNKLSVSVILLVLSLVTVSILGLAAVLYKKTCSKSKYAWNKDQVLSLNKEKAPKIQFVNILQSDTGKHET